LQDIDAAIGLPPISAAMADLLGTGAGRSGGITPGRVLVIADGSLAGLVALAIASEETVRRENVGVAEPPVVWLPSMGSEAAQADRAVRRQAEAYGAVYVGMGAGSGVASIDGGAPGPTRTATLIQAGTLALANVCRRVVWPVQDGGETPDDLASVESIGRELDRALLAGRLVSLEAPEAGLPEVRFETPFVDLSDRQLAELADDLAVPVETCRWWGARRGPRGRRGARWGACAAAGGGAESRFSLGRNAFRGTLAPGRIREATRDERCTTDDRGCGRLCGSGGRRR
jgi:hypothetical protein